MAWSTGQTLAARFEEASQLGRAWHPHWKLGTSYGGFTAAVGRWSDELVPGLVYLWPEKFRHQPPLVLRLIELRRDKQIIYLLTNVLDRQRLSDQDASLLYQMRWGVEVFYRSYKQTLDRRTVKSWTPATSLAEVAATMLGLWLLGLLTVSRLLARGVDPLRWSVAKARDVTRRAMRYQNSARRPRRGSPPRSFQQALAHAMRD